MRLLFLSFSTLFLGCGLSAPKCTTGASDLKITNMQGGILHQADTVCANWNTDSLTLDLKDVEVASDEKLTGFTLSSRVNPQTAGVFDCGRSELGVSLNVNMTSDRRHQYAGEWYLAGHDPGSQVQGTSCSWEVITPPASEASSAIAGNFVGRLARVKTAGDIEYVDVRFNFATKE